MNFGGNGRNGKGKNIVGVENFSLVIEGSNLGIMNEEDLDILLDSNEKRKRRHELGGDKTHTNEIEMDNLTTKNW